MSKESVDFELYKGKSFASLCKDIVTNSEDKRNQVDILISDLRGMIKTIPEAVMVIPLLKDYYDVSIKNDDQLVKLAAIIQRIISGKAAGEDSAGGLTLTEDEKKQLMESVEEAVKEMESKVPDHSTKIKDIKEKIKKDSA